MLLRLAEEMPTLLIEIVEVEGHCPVYEVGDIFRIEEGYQLVSDKPVCMHALQSISPYYVALSRGVQPADLGLSGPRQGATYVQCLDPVAYTDGGTVTFEITVKEDTLED
jgi:uncharacterized repeat protein (TIGR04076 family)